MNKNKGITLIALVITVVILIILAAVTINVALGEHGLVNQAKKAKNETEDSVEEEKGKLENLLEEYNRIISGGTTLDIIFGEVEWSNQKASVEVGTSSDYEIEYRINEEGTWSKIDNWTKIENLVHGDDIEARLVKDGEVVETQKFEVRDEIPPKITEFKATVLNYGGGSGEIQFNELTVDFNVEDNETGLADTVTIQVYDKDTGSAQTISIAPNETPVTFYNVTSTNIEVKIEVYDNAGNKTEEVTTAIEQSTI